MSEFPTAAPASVPAGRLRSAWRAVRLGALQGGALLRALAEEQLRRPGAAFSSDTRWVDGLTGPVEILRDRAGVPHCFAQSAGDALYALGFVHAQDRLWQLDFYRRAGSGRLAEVVGPVALEVDRLMRTLGLHRAARAAWRATPPDFVAQLEPYHAGINAGMAASPLPLEFRILDYEPEPWTGVDTALWAKLLAFTLSPAWEAQIARARVVEQAGLEALLAVDRGYPAAAPVIAPPGAPYGELSAPLRRSYATLVRRLGLGGAPAASNSWAVAPRRSASGRALLAADPHLAPVFPPFAYFVHLHCPEWALAGASLAGLPGVIWGFNRRVAWAATAGLASTQDVVVEEFAPGSDRYRTPDGWAEAIRVVERIQVRGYPTETLTVRVTRNGPVVSPQIPGVRQALALRSAVLDPSHSAGALLALPRARDIAEARAALGQFHEFNLVMAYADVAGHIGMQVVGAIPQRRPGQGWLPGAGWDRESDWTGYVPPAELPAVIDPPDGRLWSANNAHAAAGAAGYPAEFLDGYRAVRIGAALAAEGSLTLEGCRALQMDRRSGPMCAVQAGLATVAPRTAVERRLLEMIAAWDGEMQPGSVAAVVVAATFSRFLERVLRARLGAAAPLLWETPHRVPTLNVIVARTGSLIEALLQERPAGWFEPSGDGPAGWTAALGEAFREAVAALRERLGPDPRRWTWGRCHQLTLRHGLGEAPALARLFNVGPIPFGGDANTVCQAGPVSVDPFTPVQAIPVLRLVVEMAEEPRAWFALAGGQSGRRGDPHHHDLLDDWRAGRLRPFQTRREAIEREGAPRLTLRPVAAGRAVVR